MKKIRRLVLWGILALNHFTYADTQPLPVEQVFEFSAVVSQQTLQLHWKIAPNYQLYRERITITATPASALSSFILPPGTVHHDASLGTYQTYEQAVDITIPIASLSVGTYPLSVSYQGCSVQGFCYMPQQRNLVLKITAPGVGSIVPADMVPINSTPLRSAASKALWLHLLSFFGLGVLLIFTPCVLPMIPILSAIIVGDKRGTRHAFGLSLSYVLAMAATYAIAGMLAGLAGARLAVWLQTPPVLIAFATLFVLLALSLFGVYELRLPTRWNNALHRVQQRYRGGNYLGAALMGGLSILIVSPCVSPPLVAALAYIGQTGDALTGGLLLLLMGLGMGLPLVIIGTVGGHLLPKAGAWMGGIKMIFGVLLLLTAVWLLQRIIPTSIALILYGVIFLMSTLMLGSWRVQQHSGLSIFRLLILSIFLLAGAALVYEGGHAFFSEKQNANATMAFFIPVRNSTDLEIALKNANGRITIIDFYADWCSECQIMEHTVFNQPDVIAALKPLQRLRADVTDNTDEQRALQNALHVYAPPTLIFFDQNGHEIKRLVGSVTKAQLLKVVT